MTVEQELGPAIVASKTVKTGQGVADRPRAGGVDLLLTCDTVSDARGKTNERFEPGWV